MGPLFSCQTLQNHITMSSEDFSPIDFLNDDQEQQPIKTKEDNVAEKFNQLVSLNLGDKVESKNGLSYISWANAWKAFKDVYPMANYKVIKNPQTGLPYFVDPAVGIMVFTEVEADGLSYTMWLPVMDSSNKAMKLEAYQYQIWNKTSRQYESKTVEAATMFDINKAIMRCLVKTLSMHGLALPLYAGEDLPESIDETKDFQQTSTLQKNKSRKQRKASGDRYDGIRQAINSTNSTQELNALYRQHENEVKNNPQILALFTARKEQLLNAA